MLLATLPLALLSASAMSVACALLSVFVVTRRWAFIGEGIAHSGFGGAGTAWILALLFPALKDLERQWLPYCGVIVFCLLTGLSIGAVTRRDRTGSDTAIGIFMVASVAWGFIAKSIYTSVTHGTDPRGWETFLFGNFREVELSFTLATTMLCIAVAGAVWLLGKEILAYCFDPATAEASGVRAGFIHYLLIMLVTLTIIVGSRVVGSVLVTALLVLPGATSLSLSRRLGPAIAIAVAVGLAASVMGVALNHQYEFLPAGPAMVLVLFVMFVMAYAGKRLRRR